MQTMTEFSVRPFATVPVDGDAGDLLEAVGAALETDAAAIGPAVGYDYEAARLDATFQVDGDALVHAGDLGVRIFNAALARAGVEPHTVGVAVVEGDDPDQLP